MLSALKILLLLYLGWCFLLFVLQRHVLFPCWMIPAPAEPALEDRKIERWWLAASFGRVEAWYLPRRRTRSRRRQSFSPTETAS